MPVTHSSSRTPPTWAAMPTSPKISAPSRPSTSVPVELQMAVTTMNAMLTMPADVTSTEFGRPSRTMRLSLPGVVMSMAQKPSSISSTPSTA